MKKECIECGELFIGRSDKRFCSTECRSAFNNKLNADDNKIVRNTNNALRKNRRILQELNPTGKVTVHKNKLLEKGFSFTYFTSIYTTKTGNNYYYCYEYGYMALENEFYLLIKNEGN